MDSVLTAMVEDRIGPGERSRLLLQTAKEYLHFDYALSLRSPVIALALALKALNPESGRGVVISALSPRYYAGVIRDLGLRPLYCDVSPAFPCICRETVEQALAANSGGPAPLCVVLHHTLGFLPDTASIAELGLPVIEDISQSFSVPPGTDKPENQRQEAGAPKERARGVFTILGLEERDMLTAGGGALLCAHNRRDSAALRNYGDLPPEYCLPDINAALAVVQFKEARKNIEKRAALAQAYVQSSLRTRHKRFIPLDDTEYNNFAFPLALEAGLKDVLAYARKKDIILESAFENTIAGSAPSGSAPSGSALTGIAPADSALTGSALSGISAGDALNCPVSHSLSLRTVLFPLYPRLRPADAERVSKLIVTIP